jgi:hypothetical protein
MLFWLTASLTEAFRVMLQTVLCGRVHSNCPTLFTEYFWHKSRQQSDLNSITGLLCSISCGIAFNSFSLRNVSRFSIS